MEFQYWFNLITIIIGLFSIGFTIFNYRIIKRGVIKTSLVGYDKKVFENNHSQEILEKQPTYIFLKNISNVILNKLKVEVKFIYINKEISNSKFHIDYINPYESVEVKIPTKKFREILSDKFEKITFENREIITPIKDLKFEIELNFKWRWFFQQKDRYELTWKSYTQHKFENIDEYLKVNITSYNKRNGQYVHKEEI